MSLEVQIDAGGGYLTVKAIGQYSRTDLAQLLDRAQEEVEKGGMGKVLLDVSEVAGVVSTFDMLELGGRLARTWKHSIRIAVVSRNGGLDRFFENVAHNRGMLLAVFPDQAPAVQWLMV
jgi:hypothetical protein